MCGDVINVKKIYYYRIFEVLGRINKKEASTESISRNSDHNKCFELEVTIEDRHFPSAWDSNKKEAEQKAAFNALIELGVLENTAEEPA